MSYFNCLNRRFSAPLAVAATLCLLPAPVLAAHNHAHTRQPHNVFHGAGANNSSATVINTHHTRVFDSAPDISARAVRLNTGVDIDFGSQLDNIVLGDKLFSHTDTVTINVGDSQKTFTAGSHVTAAEYAAVKQVLLGGDQKISIDADGRALGGQVDLTSIATKGDRMVVQDLFIPSQLTAFEDVGKNSKFQVSGDLVNAGSIYAYSSRRGFNTGTIQAENISNQKDALISSVSEGAPINLTLAAIGSISNSGVISVSGDLGVTAPDVKNHGTMQSSSGNVQLNSPVDLSLDNNGGTISATNGSITIREASYSDSFNTNIVGGNLLSKTVDVYCGNGTADINVQSMPGMLNESGFASHVAVADDVLNLGNICLAGDPTYKNSAGDIALNGDILVQQALAIIAKGSIFNTTALTIQAGNNTTGFPIKLIAGAEFFTNAGTDSSNLGPFPPVPAGTATTITGDGSTTGGSIFLGTGAGGKVLISTQATNKSGSSNSADILMAAYEGGGTTLGQICLTGSITNSSGKGSGANGDITIIAGGESGTTPNGTTTKAIETGSIIASNGGSGANGNIFIRAIRPKSSDNMNIVFDANGNITSGNTIGEASVVQNDGDVIVNGDITAKNTLTIVCGAASTTDVLIKSGVTVSTTSPTGIITLRGFANGGVQSESGSLISTNTLTLITNQGDIGQLNPILTNATNLILSGDASLTSMFVQDSANFVVVNTPAALSSVNIVANNTIMNADGFPITANTVNLESLSGSVGFSQNAPIEIKAGNVTVKAGGGDAFIHNSTASDMSLIGVNSATGTWNLHTNNGFLAASATQVTAKSIVLDIDGTLLIGTNPELHATQRIDLIAAGPIQNGNFGTIATTTPLLNFDMATGDLGTSGAHYVPGAGVRAIGLNLVTGSAFIADPAGGLKKGFGIASSFVGNLLNYIGSGKTVVIGDLTATGISIVTGKSSINFAPNVHVNGTAFILTQVTDTNPSTIKKAKINVGKNVSLESHANSAGFGDIRFTIGTAPGSPVAGTPPVKGVGFATAGTGAIFWGTAGITAKTPNNSLYAKDTNIVFNNAVAAKNINLLGGVKINAE